MVDRVFIHTNDRQMIGAIVARHALARMAAASASLRIKILRREDFPLFDVFEGRKYLRAGGWRVWRNADLQSFTPLRFAPPEIMGYVGRAVVIDPDIFALADICALLARDMCGKAVCARPRPGHNGVAAYRASSVMLLDCAQLTRWRMAAQFEAMFAGRLDYDDWITLAAEPAGMVGDLEPGWNDFDQLTPETKLLHNTKRRTQPWKTGLPIDFTNRVPLIGRFLPNAGIRLPGRYRPHPDRRQEDVFFALLGECVDGGEVSEARLRNEMALGHLRRDALEKLRAAPRLESVLAAVAARG